MILSATPESLITFITLEMIGTPRKCFMFLFGILLLPDRAGITTVILIRVTPLVLYK